MQEAIKKVLNYTFLVASYFDSYIDSIYINYKLLYILFADIPSTKHNINTRTKSMNTIKYAQKNERA